MFDKDFELFLADTEEGIALNQRVRYRVFCLEKGFEDATEFPDGRERDPWDEVSVHFAVREKATGNWVGATRIILPLAEQFPVEQQDGLVREHAEGVPRYTLSEVSRICIVRDGGPVVAFPGGASGGATDEVAGVSNRRQERDVLLGLIRAIIEYCLDHGIRHGYMFVTDAFAKLLERLGVAFHQVGERTEYRGIRAPYFIDYALTKQQMCAHSAEVAEHFEAWDQAYRPISALRVPAVPEVIVSGPVVSGTHKVARRS
ncbi:MAG: PEP-CTERM/exosortase system-associated acyltransferase [Desulfobacterales bacterium]|jgi:N-acyl amino acid synthase of PEP-CTERM/exosortase system|nr:PEP-CTERM/exosortase system-associated acyltransferase [Desulfobacterales bacterium]